jgi:hypothetical protein
MALGIARMISLVTARFLNNLGHADTGLTISYFFQVMYNVVVVIEILKLLGNHAYLPMLHIHLKLPILCQTVYIWV